MILRTLLASNNIKATLPEPVALSMIIAFLSLAEPWLRLSHTIHLPFFPFGFEKIVSALWDLVFCPCLVYLTVSLCMTTAGVIPSTSFHLSANYAPGQCELSG
jgi:hypothetical protein